MNIKNFEDDVSEIDLSKINKFTRHPLSSKDVATFEFALCSNDIDEEYEYFDNDALQSIKQMAVGSIGFLKDYVLLRVRIYDCSVKTSTKLNKHKEPYQKVIAKAYTTKNQISERFVENVSKAKVEVSIGCGIANCTCSICGADLRTSACQHTKGKQYGGKMCCGVLSGVTDFYEWTLAEKKIGDDNVMVNEHDNDFMTLEETHENNSGDFILDQYSNGKKVIWELINNGYCVTAWQDKNYNVHVNFRSMS